MVISNESNGPSENRSSSSWLKIVVWKQNNSNFSLLYLNMSSKKFHSLLCSQHFKCVGKIETSCLLRKSIVNHPFMVRKILEFVASRHVKNVFPRLKSYIKLLNPKNMSLERSLLKTWRDGIGWTAPSMKPLPHFDSVGFDRNAFYNCFIELYINWYASDMQLNKMSTHRDSRIVICSIFLKDLFLVLSWFSLYICFSTRW